MKKKALREMLAHSEARAGQLASQIETLGTQVTRLKTKEHEARAARVAALEEGITNILENPGCTVTVITPNGTLIRGLVTNLVSEVSPIFDGIGYREGLRSADLVLALQP